jgi:hypothetical protein
MEVELKELYSTPWEFGEEVILDEEHVLAVQAFIGPRETNVSQCFLITVCNQKYVQKRIREVGLFNGLWYLVMDFPDQKKIREYVIRFIEKHDFDSWDEWHSKLRLLGKSEYEDYNKEN